MNQLTDTIVAQASPVGLGSRGIVRLSGPEAFAIASALATQRLPAHERRIVATLLQFDGIALPADLYLWPGPRTYTGQTLVEVHTFAAAPLLEALVAECLRLGARAAQPGEFTMRAFLAGKLDLTRVEAVLAVIEADDEAELKLALGQLAGGVSRPLQLVRDDLLNLLADLEAGLDFADEDIQFISRDDMLARVSKALAQLMLIRKQLDERSLSERPFRVVLAGAPNAGKSSLFNALAGRRAALVSASAGTTRDYLSCQIDVDGVRIELVDTAGLGGTLGEIDTAAQQLGRHQHAGADLILWCHDATAVNGSPDVRGKETVVATKCDLVEHSQARLATSSHTGAGISELRSFLAEKARAHHRPALAPSLSRCRHHVETCISLLRRIHALVLNDTAPELIAIDVRCALDQLGEMVGAVYTNDLLDRIFSRFCIGK